MRKTLVTLTICGLLAGGLLLPKARRGQAEADDGPAAVRQGPRVLKGGDHGIGRMVADATFVDLAGQEHSLAALCRDRIVVVAQTSTSCPLSQKYLPSLVEIAKEFAPRGVRLVLVNTVSTDDVSAMQDAAARFAEWGKDDAVVYVHDPKAALARTVGAKTTTDVVVLDVARTVVYHGAVDDQYGFGYAKDRPQARYLHDALAALMAGKSPEIAATDAPGCALDAGSGKSTAAANEVTYHNRISRIIQRNCLECHRDGGSGPFSLASYEDVAAHAPMIRQVVDRGLMPPWFAVPSKESKHAGFANDRSLAAAEKRDLLAWLASSKPEGNKADAPQPIVFADDWSIGKPDAVFTFAEPQKIKATGTMPYQNIVVETDLPEEKWVQAVEIRPGNRSVVHHVLVFAVGSGDDVGADDQQEGRQGYWAIYVPGNGARVFDPGFAKRLPKGAKLRFQMHYTPSGTATEDSTSIGFIFAKEPPEHEVRVAGIVNVRLKIPPGEANHEEVAQLRLPFDVAVLGFLPHMHVRGKACKYEAQASDGTQTLLDIPRYDFNWQLLYRLTEPLDLKRGDLLKFTAWYDNSKDNPANPDPTKTVRWGPQTYDEMHLGYVEYYVPGVKPGEASGDTAQKPGGRLQKIVAAVADRALFERFDKNDDQSISAEELNDGLQNFPRLKDNPRFGKLLFTRGDSDQDGKLDFAEFDKLREAVSSGRLKPE
ncbi:MAG: redoxin family protein [Planctomycetes bacterium]|nr:redoxin family protein [Planctomycetota bacterium]